MSRVRELLLSSLLMALPLGQLWGQTAGNGDKAKQAGGAPKAVVKASAAGYDWRSERKKLKSLISAEVEKRVAASISRELVVKELRQQSAQMEQELVPIIEVRRQRMYKQELQKWKEQTDGSFSYPDMKPFLNVKRKGITWKYPMDEAKGTPQKVREALKAELEAAFDKACPIKNEAALSAKAREKYPLIRLDGNHRAVHVKCKLRVARGGKKEIEGMLRKIEPAGIRVDNQLISRSDMTDETATLFFEDINDAFVQKYIKEQQWKYSSFRGGFVEEWGTILLPERLVAAGFIPRAYIFGTGKGFNDRYLPRLSASLQDWISAKAYAKQYYEHEVGRVRRQVLASVQADWFAHATMHGCREEYVYCKQVRDYVPCSKLQDIIQSTEH